MSSVSGAIATFLVNAAWEVPLIAGAGYAMSGLLKKLGPEAEHFAWLSTSAVALVVPAVPLLRQLSISAFAPGTSSAHPSITLFAARSADLKMDSVLFLPTSVIVALMVVYLASLFCFALRFLVSFYRAKKLVREASAVSLTEQQEQILRICKDSYSLETVRILSSRRVSGPVTLGFRKPVLLVPEGFSPRCTEQDFLAALAHECAHIKRQDFQKNLFYEAGCLILAFHPVMWIIKSKIAQTREMICDSMATESLIDSRSYMQSLLRLSAMIASVPRPSTSQAIGIFDADILEKRIMIMRAKKKPIGAGLRYSLIVPAIITLLLAGAGGVAMAVVIEPATNSQAVTKAKPSRHVYSVGKDVSMPTILKSSDAEFPKTASAAKVSDGICLVGLVVDESGLPQNIHVARSLSPEFDANAIKAVQKYRFAPAKRLGTPVAVAVNIEIHFKRY
jgi:TonB family protein